MVLCVGTELKVYDITNTTLQATVPAWDVSWSQSLGGGGFLSATCDARAEPLASDPDLLDDCVIRVGIDTGTGSFTQIAAYANRARNGIIWDGAGKQTRQVRSAPTLLTAWAQDAILHDEANSIPQFSSGQLYFGCMSTIYDYTTYDTAMWETPSANAGQQDSTTGARAGNPDAWPAALGDAYWITRGPTNRGDRHLFLADVTVTADAYCTVYFSSDESAAVYFAGELVLNTQSSETGYQEMSTWSSWVEAGTYRVLVDKTTVVSRGGDGRDPVLLAVATNTDTGAVDDILLVTNTTDWKVCTLDPVNGEAPALTPGQILLQLHGQAVARGVTTWQSIATDITAANDSASNPWGRREERTWRIGYDSYLDMIESLGDLGFAPSITPGNVLQAWANKGTDRTATVSIAALTGADSITENGVGVAATYLPVETQDGWVIVENTLAQSTYGRREQALSLGNAPSIAQGRRLGQEVIDKRLSLPTSEWSVEFYATTSTTPFADFDLGDTILVTVGGTSYARVVLEIGASSPSTEGIIRWTVKTGPEIGSASPALVMASGAALDPVASSSPSSGVAAATGAANQPTVTTT